MNAVSGSPSNEINSSSTQCAIPWSSKARWMASSCLAGAMIRPGAIRSPITCSDFWVELSIIVLCIAMRGVGDEHFQPALRTRQLGHSIIIRPGRQLTNERRFADPRRPNSLSLLSSQDTNSRPRCVSSQSRQSQTPEGFAQEPCTRIRATTPMRWRSMTAWPNRRAGRRCRDLRL